MNNPDDATKSLLKQFYQGFNEDLEANELLVWEEKLSDQIVSIFSERPHGKLPEWLDILQALPEITPTEINLNSDILHIGTAEDCDNSTQQVLTRSLKQLHPWRKGPYELFGIHIDTEWHSDWKWQRIIPYISPLQNRRILDVGCGNGYHMWRMLGAGARLVIGADPSHFFLIQFQVFKRYITHALTHTPVHLIPLKSEELPSFDQKRPGLGFDTVFSMGVLYHRASPINHLQELKSFLRPGGELVLETLIIEGQGQQLLIPRDRYAKMRNVWFIPNTAILIRMLERVGFINIRLVDTNRTSIEEQRKTEWMNYESLDDFLDPEDNRLTVEGYPAPLRAVLVCNVP